MLAHILPIGLALAGLLGALGQGLFAWIAVLVTGILLFVV